MELFAGEELLLRRAVVCASGLIYWGGVLVQARRVRRKIGRTPNLTPSGTKERLLWIGWLIVVTGWIVQPLLIAGPDFPPLQLVPALIQPFSLLAGIGLIVLGYLGTLWCYAAMGEAWRIGIDQNSASLVQNGPYQRMRHPIYSFQIVMLIGAALLLPTPVSFGIIGLHVFCAWIKASDEERHLTGLHGADYTAYLSRTGRFVPKW